MLKYKIPQIVTLIRDYLIQSDMADAAKLMFLHICNQLKSPQDIS